MPEADSAARTVVILADDLIWSTRLRDAVTAAGAIAQPARRLADFQRLLSAREAPGGLAIIDLTARGYDGVDAIRVAAAAGARVVAVGQHDDAALRSQALEAGAERVFTYRALFENGPRTLAAWLAK